MTARADLTTDELRLGRRRPRWSASSPAGRSHGRCRPSAPLPHVAMRNLDRGHRTEVLLGDAAVFAAEQRGDDGRAGKAEPLLVHQIVVDLRVRLPRSNARRVRARDADGLGAAGVVTQQVMHLVHEHRTHLRHRPLLEPVGIDVEPPVAVDAERAEARHCDRVEGEHRRTEVRITVGMHHPEAGRGELGSFTRSPATGPAARSTGARARISAGAGAPGGRLARGRARPLRRRRGGRPRRAAITCHACAHRSGVLRATTAAATARAPPAPGRRAGQTEPRRRGEHGFGVGQVHAANPREELDARARSDGPEDERVADRGDASTAFGRGPEARHHLPATGAGPAPTGVGRVVRHRAQQRRAGGDERGRPDLERRAAPTPRSRAARRPAARASDRRCPPRRRPRRRASRDGRSGWRGGRRGPSPRPPGRAGWPRPRATTSGGSSRSPTQRSSTTRSSAACTAGGAVEISSKNRIPCSASASRRGPRAGARSAPRRRPRRAAR